MCEVTEAPCFSCAVGWHHLILSRMTPLPPLYLADMLSELVAQVAVLRSKVDTLLLDDSTSSVASPLGKEYERLVDDRVDDWLRELCGLRVLPLSRRRVAEQDPSSGKVEWDGRFSVALIPEWTVPQHAKDFLVYGGGAYLRPPAIAPRRLSPAKPTLGTEYLAVLEYTRRPGWATVRTDKTGRTHKSLIQRCEERLVTCVERAKAAGMRASTKVTDVVALVGLVGEDDCQESFEAQMSAPRCPQPLLQALFRERRVVFFRCSFKLNVKASPIASPRRELFSGSGAIGTHTG